MKGRRHVAGLLAVAALTGCTIGEAADVPVTATPSPTPSSPATTAPEPTPEPVHAVAALASEPAAVAVAEILAGRDGSEPLIVEAVLAPEQRQRLRELDGLIVVAATDRGGSRLASSAELTVPTTVRRIDGVEEGLAEIVRDALADPDGVASALHLSLVDEPSTAATLATDLPHGDVLVVTPGDPRTAGPGQEALQLAMAAGWTVEAGAEVEPWMLDVVRGGLEAPGGGQLLDGKRFVAMYGTPGTGSLGVLGEQSLDATVTRIAEIAAPYDDGSATIVPTFEIIADVAAAGATDDGDYSYSIDDELIRAWVDRAAEEGFQVILDIQPGRTDFLTHAKPLEEFLIQPHVGLALDPEWRLKPNQVHLRQIGTVTGTEINTVVDWLAGLVREHALPQKMLVLHQFKFSMITEFDVIRVPDELQVTLHMDGQGGLQSKYATFDSLFGAQRPQQLGMAVGWKNFYDEDRPMATPEQVLALVPQPSLITFQ